jgi:hypothetical protein
MGKKIRIRDEQPVSYFRQLRNNFWVKILEIRDGKSSNPGWKKFGSVISIPDWQHCLPDTVNDMVVFNVSPVIWFIIIQLIKSPGDAAGCSKGLSIDFLNY